MVSVRAMVALVIAPLFGGLFLQGCGGGGGGGGGDSTTIPGIAEKNKALSTLVTALKTAGLVDKLSGKGPFTVFAPSNAAFSALDGELTYLLHNKTALTKVLEYHVVAGAVLSSALKNNQKVPTLEGADVDVTITTRGGVTTVMINGALVTTADVKASNGVVHIINKVLIPPGFEAPKIPELATSAGLKTLVAAVTAANDGTYNLTTVLSGHGPWTVFAPTDAAFNNLPKGILAALLKKENAKALVQLLRYHVVSSEVVAADLKNGEHVKTLEGQDVNITISGSTVSIDKAKVTEPDVYAANGVVHVINEVMLPPGFVLPTPAPTPPICKEVKYGLKCDDKNIDELPGKSQDECCEMCISTEGCGAWTWKNLSWEPHPTCYMKKDCSAQTYSMKGWVSGMVKTVFQVVV